jgi:hypothetical protein
MQVQFIPRTNGPERLVCDAEIVFDEPGPLWNMKLVGFALWRSTDGDVYVTFPSRAFGAGVDRKYFDYLRPADGNVGSTRNVRSWILTEYRRAGESEPPAAADAARP